MANLQTCRPHNVEKFAIMRGLGVGIVRMRPIVAREIVEWSGGGLRQYQREKLLQRKRIGGTPRNRALGIQAFDVHRPPLGSLDHMKRLDRLARAGKIRETKDWRSLVYMSMSAVPYRPDLTVKPP